MDNSDKRWQSVSIDLSMMNCNFHPTGMAQTFTYGHSVVPAHRHYCQVLEWILQSKKPMVAAYWTTWKASQVVTRCGNAIILGYVQYAYGSGWKSFVDKAKLVAQQRGFQWPTSATRWG